MEATTAIQGDSAAEAAKTAEEIRREKTEEERAGRWPRANKSRETEQKAAVGQRNRSVGSARE